jgi:hypothetical protein
MNGRRLNVFALASIGALAALGACTQTDSSADAPRVTHTDTAARASGSSQTISTSPERRAAANYTGLRYESLPRGFALHGGSVLPATNGADYDFVHVKTPRGDMIWLDSLGRATGAAGATRAKVVRAALPIPPLARDERLVMASCDVRGKLDPRVVAIVVDDANATRFTQVRQAWRVDFGAHRFDVLPVEGIVCEDPGS